METILSSFVGCIRRCESRARNRNSGTCETSFDKDCLGAMAELAYCKFRNQFWSGSVGSFRSADVGINVQIRHTTLENGCLIIRHYDDLNHYYVLVTGNVPTFTVVGWIKGADAIKKEYIRAPCGREPEYFVPQYELHEFKLVGQ